MIPPPAAPTAAVDPFEGLPAIFRDVVEPRPRSRYDLSHPWRDDGFVYAGDGRIVVRVAEATVEWHALAAIPVRGAVGRQPSDLGLLFDGIAVADEPLTLPWVLAERVTCPECWGTGRLIDPTTGRPARADLGEAFDCEDCGGVGTTRNRAAFRVAADLALAAGLVALLVRHGATVYRSGLRVAAMEISPAWFLTADGAEGLIAPIRPAAVAAAMVGEVIRRVDRQTGPGRGPRPPDRNRKGG